MAWLVARLLESPICKKEPTRDQPLKEVLVVLKLRNTKLSNCCTRYSRTYKTPVPTTATCSNHQSTHDKLEEYSAVMNSNAVAQAIKVYCFACGRVPKPFLVSFSSTPQTAPYWSGLYALSADESSRTDFDDFPSLCSKSSRCADKTQ